MDLLRLLQGIFILSKFNPVNSYHYLFNIRFNIITYTRKSPNLPVFFSLSRQNRVYNTAFSHTHNLPFTSYPCSRVYKFSKLLFSIVNSERSTK